MVVVLRQNAGDHGKQGDENDDLFGTEFGICLLFVSNWLLLGGLIGAPFQGIAHWLISCPSTYLLVHFECFLFSFSYLAVHEWLISGLYLDRA